MNTEIIFERFNGVKIDLIEYDYGSANDSLGYVTWQPRWNQFDRNWYEFGQPTAAAGIIPRAKYVGGTVVIEHGTDFDNVIKENIAPIEYYELLVSEPSEGSLYEITFSIQPYVPADLVQGLYKASNIRLQREADLQNAQDRQRLEAERVRAVEQQRIAEQQAAAARAQALREQNARQLATNCAQVGQLRSSVQAYGPTTRSNFTNIGRSPIPRWSWRRAQRKLRTCIRAA